MNQTVNINFNISGNAANATANISNNVTQLFSSISFICSSNSSDIDGKSFFSNFTRSLTDDRIDFTALNDIYVRELHIFAQIN